MLNKVNRENFKKIKGMLYFFGSLNQPEKYGGIMNRLCVTALAAGLSVGLTANAFAGERYQDRQFTVDVKRDVVYASDVPALSSHHFITQALFAYKMTNQDATVAYFYSDEKTTTPTDMKMDIYMPEKDSKTDRAAVLVVHGGAMVAGSKGDFAQHTVNYCDSLAARGYVAASMDYRLGVTLTSRDAQLHIDSTHFARAVYRGVQDVRAAVRYLRANAEDLGINPNRIYLVGNSAGAILSLENIYSTTEEDFPDYMDSEPLLGALDLYGEQGYDSKANGVAALWGAIHNLEMVGDNERPVLLIHGTADETVLFKTGRPLSNLPGVLKNIIPSEMGALAASYTLDLQTPTLYGSYVIDSLLTEKEIEHETYFVEGVAHEFYDEAPYTESVQNRVFNFLYSLTQATESIETKPIFATAQNAVQMGKMNQSFTVLRGQNLKFRVYDLRGRAVMPTGNISAGETVNLNTLDAGVYVLMVQGYRPVRFGLRK